MTPTAAAPGAWILRRHLLHTAPHLGPALGRRIPPLVASCSSNFSQRCTFSLQRCISRSSSWENNSARCPSRSVTSDRTGGSLEVALPERRVPAPHITQCELDCDLSAGEVCLARRKILLDGGQGCSSNNVTSIADGKEPSAALAEVGAGHRARIVPSGGEGSTSAALMAEALGVAPLRHHDRCRRRLHDHRQWRRRLHHGDHRPRE